jgi:hypothetical protein
MGFFGDLRSGIADFAGSAGGLFSGAAGQIFGAGANVLRGLPPGRGPAGFFGGLGDVVGDVAGNVIRSSLGGLLTPPGNLPGPFSGVPRFPGGLPGTVPTLPPVLTGAAREAAIRATLAGASAPGIENIPGISGMGGFVQSPESLRALQQQAGFLGFPTTGSIGGDIGKAAEFLSDPLGTVGELIFGGQQTRSSMQLPATAQPGGNPLGNLIQSFLGFDQPTSAVAAPALASGQRIYAYHQNMITGHVSARQKGFFAPNPVSGAMQHWTPSGRCILFAGDLAAKKRVERVARHAGGSRRRRGR